MNGSKSKENLPDELSKSCKEDNNEIKDDRHFLESMLDVEVKPFKKINIKINLRSLLMITGSLFLTALCCIFYEISHWKSTSPKQNSNKTGNFSFTSDKISLDKNESLSRKANLTIDLSALNQSTSADRYESITTIFSIQKLKEIDMSTKIPLPYDDAKRSTNEIPEDEQEKEGQMEYLYRNGEQPMEKICSQVEISSTKHMEERYSELFGIYKPAGRAAFFDNNSTIIYQQKTTKSLLYFASSSYQINHYVIGQTWVLISENHLAYIISCDERNQTDLNCTPKWSFCKEIFEPSSVKWDCELDEATIFQCIEKDTTISIDDMIIHSNEVKEVCKVFDFLSEGSITKFSPQILGVYSLEDNLYNNKVVYVNKDTGVYLYYDSNFNDTTIDTGMDALIYKSSGPGSWVISNYLGSPNVLSYNNICIDSEFPANGECMIGWRYSPMPEVFPIDIYASVSCRVPKSVSNTKPMNSTCKRLEFLSNKAFEIDGLIFYLGEYTIMDSLHNGEAAYRKQLPFFFNHSYVFLHLINYNVWMISYGIGTNTYLFANEHCGRLRNPTDSKCNGGWFYADQLTSKWKYDSSMNMQCIEYF